MYKLGHKLKRTFSFFAIAVSALFLFSAAANAFPYDLQDGGLWNYDLSASDVNPAANPALIPACSPLRISIILDKSGSMSEDDDFNPNLAEAEATRNALKSFIQNMDSSFPGGLYFNYIVFADKVESYPRPFASNSGSAWLTPSQAEAAITMPSGAIAAFKHENIALPGDLPNQIPYNLPGSHAPGTNWDGAFQALNLLNLNNAFGSPQEPESSAVLFVTDGDPTVSMYESNDLPSPPDPNRWEAFVGNSVTGPNGIGTASDLTGTPYLNSSTEAYYELKMAVKAANVTKSQGKPIYGFGVNFGSASAQAANNLGQISGSNTKTSDYAGLADTLNSFKDDFASACAKPNVKVTKTLLTSGDVHPGDTINWGITAENDSTVAASNVVVNDVLPSGWTVAAGSTVPAGTTLSGTTWTVGSLAAGESKDLVLKVKVPDDAAMSFTCDPGPNIFTNTANITATVDDNSADNNSSATVCIKPESKEVERYFDVEPQICDLDRATWDNVGLITGLTATESSATNLPKIELTGYAKNGAALTTVNTDLTTPKEYSITDSTALTSELRLKVKYYYRPSLEPKITNALIGLDMSAIVTPTDNLVASGCPIDLTAEKTSNFSTIADTAGVGSEFEYTLTFTNKGPNDAYNGVITDTLPAGNIVELSGSNPFTYTTVPAATTVSCSPVASSTGFTCNVNKMISTAKNASAKVEIKVKVKLTQEYLDSYLASDAYNDTDDFSLHAAMDVMTNNVSIAPGEHPTTGEVQPDTDSTNNNDSVTDQPQAADIEVIKLISPIGGGGIPLLREIGATPGWAIPEKKYITPTGQVYISQDISPNTEGWNIQKVDYMIFVINRGPNSQKGVVLQDTRTASDGNSPLTIDTGYGVLTNEMSPNPSYGTLTGETGVITGVTATTATIDWPVGDLAPGEAKGMFYRVNYSDDADTYSNMVENVTPGPNRDPDSNSSNCDTLPNEDDCDTTNITKNAGSLIITKSVSPGEVSSVDQPVTYTIRVQNNGSMDYATNEYSITDTLPGGLDYVSSTPDAKCAYDATSRLITCTDLGPLPKGNPITGTGRGEVTIVVNAKTNAEITAQTDITNVACVIPTIPTMGTTEGKLCDEAEIVTKSVDLELTKTIIGSQGVYIGDEIQYEISLINKGPGTAENVVIKETYPDTVEFVSALPELGEYNSSTHEWMVPEIGANQIIKLKVNVKVLDYSDNDDRINRAEIISCKQGEADCDDTDSTPDNCEEGVNKEDDCAEAEFHEPIHDIELTKTIVNQANSYKIGDTVDYLITLTNKGPDTAKNLAIKENMPTELEYLYHEAPVISTYDPATHEWIVRSITSGQSLELKLTARITKFASSLTNIAEWVGCKDVSGKEVKCGKDPDSTPNNCDSGKNKEDDCGDTTIKLSAGGSGRGIGVPVTGALVGKIIAGATGISLAAYLGRDLMLRHQKKSNSER